MIQSTTTDPPLVASVLIGSITLLLYYYFTYVVERPRIICQDGKLKKMIVEKMPLVTQDFYPTPWCFNSYAQMIISNKLRELLPDVKYDRTLVELNDGGVLALDIHPSDLPSEAPIAFMLTGLTGDSQTEYIKSMLASAVGAGCRVAVMNNRGKGGVKLRTPKTYCGVSLEDLEATLKHVKTMYPSALILASGVSFGTVLLGNYLSAAKEKSLVDGAFLLSGIFDIEKSSRNVEKPGINAIVNGVLTSGLVSSIATHRDIIGNAVDDFELVLKSKTIREFDSRITAKVNGFKSVEEYYAAGELCEKMKDIRTPTVCLSADDDMFQMGDELPLDAPSVNENVAFILTNRGGHVGFMDGIIPWTPFLCERIYAQFLQAMAATAKKR